MSVDKRAKEISEFLKVPEGYAKQRLEKGFHYNHHEVANDFNDGRTNVNNSESLLNWYRNTETYIWELSAYHLDQGFNYSGMCEGIALGLRHSGKNKVLSLGDGIGSLSIRLAQEGLEATYHDLEGGKTANFAQYRFSLEEKLVINTLFTNTFEPKLGDRLFDAVVALDFFEHVVNVEEWAKAVYNTLKKDGVFIPNNAFGIGDAEHGNSIPMHLSVNNRFEWDWDPMLVELGFVRHENNSWWIKK
jgi:2-polyprenyl-3-methyl-5-hydroxy-6-metoxy-1,4-benzoquinol methylase